MTQQYSDDNPYAKLRLVSDPAFGADYGIGLRADTLKQVAISKADCWEEGYHRHAEEVAKLRAENEGLMGKVWDCIRCYDTQQGIEDILVDQIIDLRAENEELRRALVKYKETQAEIEARQERENAWFRREWWRWW